MSAAPDPTAAELLDRVEAFLGRFVSYPTDPKRGAVARVAHTLWIAHTHLMDAWESTPRLAFLLLAAVPDEDEGDRFGEHGASWWAGPG